MDIELIDKSIEEHGLLLSRVKTLRERIYKVSIELVSTLNRGNTIFLCGNGGSAADAQHIAAEFTGRFSRERHGLSAIALTTDTSALTAIGNDYGYSKIFSRQIEALGRSGDLLIAISTSGNSENILEAIKVARLKNMNVVGLSGKDGGLMSKICNNNLVIPSTNTARIQEMHILIGHIFCELVELHI